MDETTPQVDGLRELLYELAGVRVWRERSPSGEDRLVKIFDAKQHPAWDLHLLEKEYERCQDLRLSVVPEPLHLKREDAITEVHYRWRGGRSLDHHLHIEQADFGQRIQLARRLLEAVASLHAAGIVHLALNPMTIWVDSEGTLQFTDLTQAVTREGRVALIQDLPELNLYQAYKAPEQFGQIEDRVDVRSDIYALGLVFYRIFSGHDAFESQDPRELLHCHLVRKPRPLTKVLEGFPSELWQVIHKMMAKIPVDRYRSIQGVMHDWDHVLQRMRQGNREPWIVGESDGQDELGVTSKLYGKGSELQNLLDRVQAFLEGQSCLLLLRGPEHSGKALLVKELWRPLAKSRGYLVQSSLPIHRQQIPYEGISAALDMHLLTLVMRPENERSYWRKKILEACGKSVALLLELLPSLERLIGSQDPLYELPAKQQHVRLELVFKNLMRVLCEPNHPLVIYIDHIERIDGATARLLRSLVIDDPVPHLLLITACQSTESSDSSVFQDFYQRMKRHAGYCEIKLHPLLPEDVQHLLHDVLRLPVDELIELSQSLADHCAGDVALMRQVLLNLKSRNLLWHDSALRCWSLNKGAAALCPSLVKEIRQQAQDWERREVLDLLEAAAIFGSSIRVKVLETMLGTDIRARVMDAVQQGWLLPFQESEYRRYSVGLDDDCRLMFSFKGLRDRILERLPRETKRILHENALRVLAGVWSDKARREDFDIGRHVVALFTEEALPVEGQMTLRLLQMARRARLLGDYTLAFEWLGVLHRHLGVRGWERQYTTMLAIGTERAKAAYMLGLREQQEAAVREVVDRAADPLDAFACHEVMLEDLLDRNIYQGIAYGKSVIRELGQVLPQEARREQVLLALIKVLLLGDPVKAVERIMQEKPCEDEKLQAAFRMSSRLGTATYLVEPFLMPLFVCRAMLEGQKHGRLDLFPLACSSFAMILGGMLGAYSYAVDLSHMARQMARQTVDPFISIRCDFLYFAFIKPWLEPIRRSMQDLLESHHRALEAGDFEFACHAFNIYTFYAFYSGRRLDTFSDEVETYGRVLMELHQNHLQPFRYIYLEAASVLKGEAESAIELEGRYFRESEHRHYIEHVKDFAFYYHTNRLMLAVFAEEWDLAIRHGEKAYALREAVFGSWAISSMVFFESLSIVEHYEEVRWRERVQLAMKLRRNRRYYRFWQSHSPSNVQHRYLIIEGEWARVQGDTEKAIDLLHKAILAAHQTGFVHEEALAAERLGRLFQRKGWRESAWHYLQKACQLYADWGAARKVQALQRELEGNELQKNKNLALADRQIDLQSFRQAIADMARETDVRQLFKRAVSSGVQFGGASSCQLLIRDQLSQRWLVTCIFEQGNLEIKGSDSVQDSASVCWPVVSYLERTRSKLLVDDAQVSQSMIPGLEKELYIVRRGVRSLLALPLITGDRDAFELQGVLCFEHNQQSHNFNPRRVEVLELIAQITAGRMELSTKASTLEAAFREVRQVQGALLPTQKLSDSFSIAHFYRSAEISGGDWFGYHEDITQKRLYMFVGDVTGHGVPSSLVTGAAAGAIYSTLYGFQYAGVHLTMTAVLEALVQAVNRTILETGARVDRMMTMAFVALDAESGEGVMISAGHQPGLLINSSKVQGLKASGLPLGHAEDAHWKPKTFQMQRGDTLFLFTDGLLENVGPGGDRIPLRLLEKNLTYGVSPKDLRRKVLELGVQAWKEHKPQDDITFLIVRWNEEKHEGRFQESA